MQFSLYYQLLYGAVHLYVGVYRRPHTIVTVTRERVYGRSHTIVTGARGGGGCTDDHTPQSQSREYYCCGSNLITCEIRYVTHCDKIMSYWYMVLVQEFHNIMCDTWIYFMTHYSRKT